VREFDDRIWQDGTHGTPSNFKEVLPNPKKVQGDKKIPLHLVPPALVIGAARALSEGADKYGAYNWRELPVETTTYISAILRHLYAYLDGEDLDPESAGKHHLDGCAASLAILMDSLESKDLIDNRPPPGPGRKLIGQWRK
jgi:hypothetical protein